MRRAPYPTWIALSEHFTPFYEQASAPDPEIRKRADELTASARNLWEKIRALCRQAQKATYISINLGAAESGYLPRAATRVFRCNYGDCKDKTTLLRALLRSQGIESYALIVFSGDSAHIRPEWPSPRQFNHCITAIKIDDSITEAPAATFVHPVLGRMMIFDPTNENVPPGLLPEEDCGGRALVLAGGQGGLITLPEARRDDNRTERNVRIKLSADGSVEGKLEENYFGLPAARLRSEFLEKSASDYQAVIEHWLARTLPSVRASQVEVHDDFDRAQFNLVTDFQSPVYGKPMRNTLLVFKPVVVSRRVSNGLKKGKRTQPVVFAPELFAEKTRITLPAGFVIDESFPSVELKTIFGSYRAAVTSTTGNEIVLERSLEFVASRVPAENYKSTREFFEKILRADQTPIVLRKADK